MTDPRCPYYPGCQPDNCTRCWKNDPPPGQVSLDDVDLDDEAFAPGMTEAERAEFSPGPRRRPGKLKGPLGVPKRDTLTGAAYFYLMEHKDEAGIVDVRPLRDLLNKRRNGPPYSSLKLVHAKINVLKQKHGMFLERCGPSTYKVKTISQSRPPEVKAMYKKIRNTFIAFGGPEAQADDFMTRMLSEFRWSEV